MKCRGTTMIKTIMIDITLIHLMMLLLFLSTHVRSEIMINDVVYNEISNELKEQLFGKANNNNNNRDSTNVDNCPPCSYDEEKQKFRIHLLEKQITLLNARVNQLEKVLSQTTHSESITESTTTSSSGTSSTNKDESKSSIFKHKVDDNKKLTESKKQQRIDSFNKDRLNQNLKKQDHHHHHHNNNQQTSPPPQSSSSKPVQDLIIGIAVSKKGEEHRTKQLIDQIKGQVDKLLLYLTGYTSSVASIHSEPIPSFLTSPSNSPWVHIYFPPDYNEVHLQRLTGKWQLLQKDFLLRYNISYTNSSISNNNTNTNNNKSDSSYFVFPLEDHIAYPKNYVNTLISAIQSFGGKAIVGLSGHILVSPFESFQTSTQKLNYNDELSENTPVHLLNVETIAFHSSTFDVPEYQKMFDINENGLAAWKIEDVIISLMAQRQGLPLIVLEHPERWVIDFNNNSNSGGGQHGEESKPDAALATSLIKKTNKDWKRRTVKPIT